MPTDDKKPAAPGEVTIDTTRPPADKKLPAAAQRSPERDTGAPARPVVKADSPISERDALAGVNAFAPILESYGYRVSIGSAPKPEIPVDLGILSRACREKVANI